MYLCHISQATYKTVFLPEGYKNANPDRTTNSLSPERPPAKVQTNPLPSLSQVKHDSNLQGHLDVYE